MPGRSLSGRAPSEPEQRVTPFAGRSTASSSSAIVGFGRDHSRQPEEREGRVVRVAAHADPDFLGRRDDLLEEGYEVGTQLVGGDGAVLGEVAAHVLEGDALGRTGQAEDDVARELRPARVVHGGEAPGGKLPDLLGKLLGRALSAEDVDVERGEVGIVEAHAGSAVRDPPGEVGARPVEHRHEVVADDLDSRVRQVAQAHPVVLDVLAPGTLLLLHVLRYRQAFDHLPADPRRRAVLPPRDLALAPGDLFGGPDIAGRHVVEGRDHPLDACLQHVVDRHEILRPEPAPGLPHGGLLRCRSRGR